MEGKCVMINKFKHIQSETNILKKEEKKKKKKSFGDGWRGGGRVRTGRGGVFIENNQFLDF